MKGDPRFLPLPNPLLRGEGTGMGISKPLSLQERGLERGLSINFMISQTSS